jgi:hypothetical protein
MKQHAYRKLLGLVCLVAVLSQGGGGAALALGPPAGMRKLVWLDLSGSVSEAQRASWLTQTVAYIVKGLASGDTIAVFGVHESSLAAAPFYVGDMPTLNSQPGLSEKLRVHAAQRKIRQEVTAVFQQVLTDKANAKWTDLFGAVDRIDPDPKGRPTLVYIFSDMLHATPDLSIEKTPLAPNMESLLRRVTTQHGWQRDHLAHTTVNCILPGERGIARVNNRVVLELFWRTLFQSLGGTLANFDTYLQVR